MEITIHQITKFTNFCVALFDAERLSAAACRLAFGFLIVNPPPVIVSTKVHLGAVQIADADRVDEQLHAVRLEDLIAAPGRSLRSSGRIENRSTAALHEYAQAVPALFSSLSSSLIFEAAVSEH